MNTSSIARGKSDFSATRRMLVLAGFAVVIGAIGAVLAWALLKLISLFTNIFYFQRFSFGEVSPADNSMAESLYSRVLSLYICAIAGMAGNISPAISPANIVLFIFRCRCPPLRVSSEVTTHIPEDSFHTIL